MNLEEVQEVRIIQIRIGVAGQDLVINQLLKVGWKIFTVLADPRADGYGQAINRYSDFVLIRRHEQVSSIPSTYFIRQVHSEQNDEQANAYIRAGWILLGTKDKYWTKEGLSGKTTIFVLGRPMGIVDFLLGNHGSPTKIERMIEGLQILRQYFANPILQPSRRRNCVLQVQADVYSDLLDSDSELLRALGWLSLDEGAWVF